MPAVMPAFSQTSKKIYNRVTDEEGKAIIAATVFVKEQDIVSDADGNFNLSVPLSTMLVISFIGYNTAEIVVKNKTVFNVMLG
ncbi:TonB-linked outer membrane protein, SusC/RagA family [Bacteroidales bacterium Barb6]|nr:TonB-linked outer membrane protein, SusC/RagA family [Bacteroidales bacterium Barb6]